MAEMKNLKIEVVRYNPEVDTAPHSAFYEVPYDATPHYWMRWATSKTTRHRHCWSCRMAICGFLRHDG